MRLYYLRHYLRRALKKACNRALLSSANTPPSQENLWLYQGSSNKQQRLHITPAFGSLAANTRRLIRA